jgi:hypothetical protein
MGRAPLELGSLLLYRGTPDFQCSLSECKLVGPRAEMFWLGILAPTMRCHPFSFPTSTGSSEMTLLILFLFAIFFPAAIGLSDSFSDWHSHIAIDLRHE